MTTPTKKDTHDDPHGADSPHTQAEVKRAAAPMAAPPPPAPPKPLDPALVAQVAGSVLAGQLAQHGFSEGDAVQAVRIARALVTEVQTQEDAAQAAAAPAPAPAHDAAA